MTAIPRSCRWQTLQGQRTTTPRIRLLSPLEPDPGCGSINPSGYMMIYVPIVYKMVRNMCSDVSNVWFVYNHQRFQISPRNDWKGLKHLSFCPCERRATDLRIWASGVSPNSHVNRENDDKRDIVTRFWDHSRFPQSRDSHGRSSTRIFPCAYARFYVLVAIEHHCVALFVHVNCKYTRSKLSE